MKCYRCQKALSPNDTTCASCGQAVYTTHTGPGLAMGRRVDGALASDPSPRDYIATANLPSLPRQVNLRQHCSAVEEQGQLASCVACSVVGAMEHAERKAGRPAAEFSRMFLYFNGRRLRGTPDRDSGMSVPQCLAAFLAFGAPPESAWPYKPDLLAKEPDAAAYAQALQNVPAEYARVEGQASIQGALAEGFPVAFIFQLPIRCYEEAARTGVVPAPSKAEVDAAFQVGGHSMLLVGYDLDKATYLVRNSWGAGWGAEGYCSVSFDTFDAAAYPGQTWILGKLGAAAALDVVRPARATGPVASSGVADLAAKMRGEIRESLTKDLQDAFKDIRSRVNPPRQGQ